MIFSTSILTKQITVLGKNPKNGYTGCISDIQNKICKLSFEELLISRDSLLIKEDDKYIIKIQVGNKDKKWSAIQGYRVIILCDKSTKKSHVLFVYPKKGDLGTPDLTSEGATILFNNFKSNEAAGEIFDSFCPQKEIIENKTSETTKVSEK